MKLSGNKILITGGASGIGLGLTERFLKEGNQVLICGRREDVLAAAKAKFQRIETFVCDLGQEQERIRLYEWIKTEHADLNVLVNNAGIQNWMKLGDGDFYQRAANEIAINAMAPVHLASLFAGLGSIHTIMNVSSGLAFVPLTQVPVYCATKAFIRSFTLSIRHLLKDKNIEVVEIIPPALNTDLGAKGLHDAYPPVSEFITSIFEQLKAGKNELTFGTSEPRAKANNEAVVPYFNMMNGIK